MSSSSRKRVVNYPEEKEGRTKDANNKLKAQVRNLKKQLKKADEANRTLSRAFNKSCDIIKDKLEGYSIEQVIQMVNDYEYKETAKGREREREKKEETKEEEDLSLQECPKCGKNKGEGFSTLTVGKITINSCSCGYRSKVDSDEGIERS